MSNPEFIPRRDARPSPIAEVIKRAAFLFLLSPFILFRGSAFAGIPQPGMVVYGKVTQNGSTLTNGILEWTYTVQGNGQTVTVRASLLLLQTTGGGILSYSVMIPLDLKVDGFASDPHALPVSNQPVLVTRSATLDGQPLQISRSVLGSEFTINQVDHVGYVERVDLLVPVQHDCCPGDADVNHYVNIDDYASVRSQFGKETPETGDADCNGFVNLRDYASVRDHFGDICGGATSTAGVITRAVARSGRVLAAVSGPGVVISAGAETGTVQVGDPVRVDLLLNSGTAPAQLAGIFLKYDPTLLRFTGAQVNTVDFNNEWLTGTPRETDSGLIAFSAGATEEFSGNHIPIATLEFTAVAKGTATISFDTAAPFATRVKNGQFKDVPTSTEGTSILIGANTGAPATVPTAGPAHLFLESSASPPPTVGSNVTVNVRLDTNGQPAGVVGAFVQFDESRLRFQSGVVYTPVFDNSLFTSVPTETESGIVSFSAASNSTISANEILVAQLQFTALASGSTDLGFSTADPRQTVVEDTDFNDLPTSVTGVTVSILPKPFAELSIEPVIQEMSVGDTTEVAVRLDANGLPVHSVEAWLSFDPAELQYESGKLQRPPFNNDQLNSQPALKSPGVVAFRATATTQVLSNDVIVARLRFKALAAGSVPIQFLYAAPTHTHLEDSAYAEIPVSTVDGLLSVDQPAFARLHIAPSEQHAVVGEQFQIQVRLDPVRTKPRYVEGFVQYDPIRLRFDGGSVSRGVFDNGPSTSDPALLSAGLVSFLAGASNDVTQVDTLVATLNFTALASGDTEVGFKTSQPQSTDVKDSSLSLLPLVVQSGNVSTENVDVTQLYVTPTAQIVRQGDSVSVDVRMSVKDDPRYVRAYVNYDPALLRFDSGSVNTGTFDNTTYTEAPAATQAGIVGVSAGATSSIQQGDVRIATLHFTSIAPGVVDLEFLETAPTESTVQDSGFATLRFTVGNGLVAGLPPPFISSSTGLFAY